MGQPLLSSSPAVDGVQSFPGRRSHTFERGSLVQVVGVVLVRDIAHPEWLETGWLAGWLVGHSFVYSWAFVLQSYPLLTPISDGVTV